MDSFSRLALETHNKCRSHHNVPPLLWSNSLARDAQIWAKKIAKEGKLKYAENLDGDGENIVMVSGGFEGAGDEASKKWYSELERYNFHSGGHHSRAPGTGHFTQMVWKSSKEFGIARAKSSDGRVFVVGRYRPGGNDLNYFNENVLPGVSDAPPFARDVPDQESKRGEAVAAVPSGSFITEVLEAHNKYRSQHNVAPVTWSEGLAYDARNWAQKIAFEGELAHANKDERKLKGENICRMSKHHGVADAVGIWYSEAKIYEFGSPGFSLETGHFTQVVWRGTRQVGAGCSKSADGKLTYVVARYDPPGNILNRFPENVLPHVS